jgi:signal transduction histidine kinase
MQVAGPIGEEQRRYLARIARAEGLLLGRINDILNFAKIDSGTLTYAMDAVPVHDALTSALSLMQPLLAQRGLACTYEGADPSVTIIADREKVEQILLNLLSNAAKFTPRGGHVTMLATTHATTVEISVADTGVGIPGDKLTTIFEPFVQVSSTLTREHEGTGLGLAISRELARAMGGDVTAASTERAGSTFTLTLTRGEKVVARAAALGQAAPETSVRAGSLRS